MEAFFICYLGSSKNPKNHKKTHSHKKPQKTKRNCFLDAHCHLFPSHLLLCEASNAISSRDILAGTLSKNAQSFTAFAESSLAFFRQYSIEPYLLKSSKIFDNRNGGFLFGGTSVSIRFLSSSVALRQKCMKGKVGRPQLCQSRRPCPSF